MTSLGTGRYDGKSHAGDAHPFAPASRPTVSKRTPDTSVYVNTHCLQTFMFLQELKENVTYKVLEGQEMVSLVSVHLYLVRLCVTR